jgi:hypothetical protein
LLSDRNIRFQQSSTTTPDASRSSNPRHNSVRLLHASIVGAQLLIPRRKRYHTVFGFESREHINFVTPVGAIFDKLWALHLTPPDQLDASGGQVWDITQALGRWFWPWFRSTRLGPESRHGETDCQKRQGWRVTT